MSDRCVDNTAPTPDKTYGIYIHIPFCKAKCAYCAFVSTPDLSLMGTYIKTLTDEISSSSVRGAKADTVYIGGGTPSCLPRGTIERLIDTVRKTFAVDGNAEITVEANPESADAEFAVECADCGVNRVSMGLQSSDDAVLRDIGRLHDLKRFIEAAECLHGVGIDNISSDMILGLPNQTMSDVENTVGIFADHCVHASIYALTVEPNTPLFLRGYTPSDDLVADMYDSAYGMLDDNGFKRYEVSNFARFGKYSRHNSKYWHFDPYLGFGAAAHGFDGEKIRYAHGDDIKDYIDNPKCELTVLSDKDRYNEYVMLSLRTETGIDKADFRRRFGFDLEQRAGEAVDRLEKSGLIISDGKRLRIVPDKMFVMNGIIEELMI